VGTDSAVSPIELPKQSRKLSTVARVIMDKFRRMRHRMSEDRPRCKEAHLLCEIRQGVAGAGGHDRGHSVGLKRQQRMVRHHRKRAVRVTGVPASNPDARHRRQQYPVLLRAVERLHLLEVRPVVVSVTRLQRFVRDRCGAGNHPMVFLIAASYSPLTAAVLRSVSSTGRWTSSGPCRRSRRR
jgi:hypothetical protein